MNILNLQRFFASTKSTEIAIMSLKKYTGEGLYLWMYIFFEIMSHFIQFNMNLIGYMIHVNIKHMVSYIYDEIFECIYVSVIILMCDQFYVYTSLYEILLSNCKTRCEGVYPFSVWYKMYISMSFYFKL